MYLNRAELKYRARQAMRSSAVSPYIMALVYSVIAYVMGLLSFGVYAFALTGPGTAQLVNVLSMQVAGEGPAAGLVGGLVGVVLMCLLQINRLSKREEVENAKTKCAGTVPLE